MNNHFKVFFVCEVDHDFVRDQDGLETWWKLTAGMNEIWLFQQFREEKKGSQWL